MRLRVKYRCGECDEIHDDEEDALDCCRPKVVQVYVCPSCGLDHDIEGDAIECCETSADDEAHRVNPIDLEAAGQQRLF